MNRYFSIISAIALLSLNSLAVCRNSTIDVSFPDSSGVRLEKLVMVDLPSLKGAGSYPLVRTGSPLVVANTIYLPVTVTYFVKEQKHCLSAIYAIDAASLKIRKRLMLNEIESNILPADHQEMEFRHFFYKEIYYHEDGKVLYNKFFFAAGLINGQFHIIKLDTGLKAVSCHSFHMRSNRIEYADWLENQIRFVFDIGPVVYECCDVDLQRMMIMNEGSIPRSRGKNYISGSKLWSCFSKSDTLHIYSYDLKCKSFMISWETSSYYVNLPPIQNCRSSMIGHTLYYDCVIYSKSSAMAEASKDQKNIFSVNLDKGEMHTLSGLDYFMNPRGILLEDEPCFLTEMYDEGQQYAAIGVMSEDRQHFNRLAQFGFSDVTDISGIYDFLDDKYLIIGSTTKKHAFSHSLGWLFGSHNYKIYDRQTLYLGVITLP